MSDKYNYIRMNVKNSTGFNKMRIKSLGDRVKAVHGFSKEGINEVQSVLFPKDQYNIKGAKSWMNQHGYNYENIFLVNDVILSSSHNITFIEEAYHEPENKTKSSKHDWLFDNRTNEEAFYGEKYE